MPSSTHMPSIIEINGRPILLFSRLERPSLWNSYYCPLDDLTRVNRLNTQTSISECSPDGYVDATGRVNISVTQGYRLVQYHGATLDNLAVVRDYGSCRAGTVLPSGEYIMCLNRSEPIMFYGCGGDVTRVLMPTQLKLPKFTLISRITFMSEDPDKILITGVTAGTDVSVLYSRTMARAWAVTVTGTPIYKYTIYRGELIYAVRGGSWFEDRYLARTRAFELTPL